MPIDFSTYAPTTVLRVRCRDGVEGCVHPNQDKSMWPHLLVRDGEGAAWIAADGQTMRDSGNIRHVTAIIGEMVLVQWEGA